MIKIQDLKDEQFYNIKAAQFKELESLIDSKIKAQKNILLTGQWFNFKVDTNTNYYSYVLEELKKEYNMNGFLIVFYKSVLGGYVISIKTK